MNQYSWLLQDEESLLTLLESISEKFSVGEGVSKEYTLSYLDTFDWRIWKKGDVLEYHESENQKKLVWRTIDNQVIHKELPVDNRPDFISDIPEWLRPAALEDITKPRSLIEQAQSHVHLNNYDIRNHEDKVVCRLVVVNEGLSHQDGSALAGRIQVSAIRGYDKAYESVVNIIKQSGMEVYGKDPLIQLLKSQGRHPCDYSNHLRLGLHPNQRADDAARQIMLQLFQMMEANESGIKIDRDTVYLKDYRYALQRAHTLVKQLKKVIPEDTRKRFEDELNWIDNETSRLYGLNNWLLDYEAHRNAVGRELRPWLGELHEMLCYKRHAELLHVVKLFEGKHYKKFMKRWRVYLECPVPDHSVLKRAESPVLKVVSRRIWKTYNKLAAHKNSNLLYLLQADMVEMCETSLALNDLLALTRTLLPSVPVAELISTLQVFQNALQVTLDRQSELQVLRWLMKEMKNKGFKDKRSALAMDGLQEHILSSQAESYKSLQSAYARLVQVDVRDRYEKLFQKS